MVTFDKEMMKGAWKQLAVRLLFIPAILGLAGCGAATNRQPATDGGLSFFGTYGPPFNIPDSQSVNYPSDGTLIQGESVLDYKDTGYFIHRGERPYGTNETVKYLVAAGKALVERLPGTAVPLIRDLSQSGGGKISGHVSHQSGRDADVGYLALGNVQLQNFVDMDAANLDTVKSWVVIKALLLTNQVRYVFVDYELQKLLYVQAVAAGEPPGLLQQEFQYPRPVSEHAGIIRHWPNHKNHLHVRFLCPQGDGACMDPQVPSLIDP